jgi:hypothetical protein
MKMGQCGFTAAAVLKLGISLKSNNDLGVDYVAFSPAIICRFCL